jgi:hypothetical protein
MRDELTAAVPLAASTCPGFGIFTGNQDDCRGPAPNLSRFNTELAWFILRTLSLGMNSFLLLKLPFVGK